MDYVCFSILLDITMDTRKLKDIVPDARINLSHTNCDKINTAKNFQSMYYTVSECGHRCTPIGYNWEFPYSRYWDKFLKCTLQGVLLDLVDG